MTNKKKVTKEMIEKEINDIRKILEKYDVTEEDLRSSLFEIDLDRPYLMFAGPWIELDVIDTPVFLHEEAFKELRYTDDQYKAINKILQYLLNSDIVKYDSSDGYLNFWYEEDEEEED